MEKIVILWTTDNKDTALEMVFPYALNSMKYGWWQEVILIIWGASERLAAHDDEIGDHIRELLDSGVKVEACKACSDNFDVTVNLANQGIDVKYMGPVITEYLKEDIRILSI